MPENVKHDGTKVWIDGVPALGWGKGRETTFCGALEAALAVTEHAYRYADLMAWSGLSFRTRWFRGGAGQRWCPSSPVGEFPDEIGAVQTATGWRLRVECRLGDPEPSMARFTPDIVASINRGLPVLAYEPRLNVDVIFGYRDGGKTLLLQDYYKNDGPLELPPEKLGAQAMWLTGHDEPLAPQAALAQALRLATSNWQRDPVASPRGQYLYGEAALAAWAEDLAGADKLAAADRDQLFFVSWWTFEALADARATAAPFLEESAPLAQGDAQDALLAAAKFYQQEAQLLGSVFGKQDAFLGPWSGKTVQAWTAEVRTREQAILKQARELETKAVAELAKAR